MSHAAKSGSMINGDPADEREGEGTTHLDENHHWPGVMLDMDNEVLLRIDSEVLLRIDRPLSPTFWVLYTSSMLK